LRLCKNNRAANLITIVTKLFTFFASIPVRASCSVSAKISDSEENLPSDVELDAQVEFAIDTLFLAKSKKRYGDSVQIF
jgi:hypothetical protein